VTGARLIERPEQLERYVQGWDSLALDEAQPLAAPGWLLAWWRHAAPPGALLRVVVLQDDGGSLIGIAPFFAHPGSAGRCDYRLLGAPLTQRRELLAAPGAEAELAEAVAVLLSKATPTPSLVSFEAIGAGSGWPELLASRYPSLLTPRVVHRLVQSAPVVTMKHQSFDEWLEERSSNFRQQLRRARRQLADAGGTIRMSDERTLPDDVGAFLQLHHSRWAERGGSGLPERTRELVLEAARGLGAGDRLRLWMVELQGEPIGAGLFIAGGGEISYLNGGFDERESRYRPPLLAIAAALEDGFARGERRLDLGGGANPYKQRFADADEPITWVSLRIRNRHYPATAAQLLGPDLRWWARVALNRLPEGPRERLKQARRRIRG
jgi:CelD/BcsL family acetyltransferase involved in cellulose biosynthesis